MLLYWIWFSELKGLSLDHKHRLLEQFGDPQELYQSADRRFALMGLSDKVRKALQDKDLKNAEEILAVCTKKRIGLLPVTSSAYPEKLRNIPDAPVLLYFRGRLPDWNAVPFIGIVGTRKASVYGLQVSHSMGRQIAAGGGFVVSGAASGGDSAAMEGALETGAPVVGVLGCGVDVIYPRHNRRLFEAVVENGCLISEYPPGAGADGWHFPARNRIISGISNGVLVVEAPERSGALITAQRALEQGRDVFAVPGNIDAQTHAGTNALLRDGAIPALSGWDVLSCYESLYPGVLHKGSAQMPAPAEWPAAKVAQDRVFPAKVPETPESPRKIPIDNGRISTYIELENNQPALSQEQQAVLAQLTRHPQESAELIARLNMPSGKVLSILTMLTVKGYACKHPGGRFSLK